MRFVKINWIHNYDDEPRFIYSAINDSGYEVKKVELFENRKPLVYSEDIRKDRLAIGKYPSLNDLNYTDKSESMITVEISREEFMKVWKENSKF